MSSIPTKQIDGDVAVGRNVSVGGKATVRGSATIGHNLKVEGWLDAPNIKGPNKGLFKTESELKKQYPFPSPGWYALVGDALPATIWVVSNHKWTATDKNWGEPNLDLTSLEAEIDSATENIAELMQSSSQLEKAVGDVYISRVSASKGVKELYISGDISESMLPITVKFFNNADPALKGLYAVLGDSGETIYRDDLDSGYIKVTGNGVEIEAIVNFYDVPEWGDEIAEVLAPAYDICYSPTIRLIRELDLIKPTLTDLQSLLTEECSKNLFDKNAIIEGFYISTASGILNADDNFAISPLIPVQPGETYYISRPPLSGQPALITNEVRFTDNEGNPLKPRGADGKEWSDYHAATDSIAVTAPATAVFLQFDVCFSGTKCDYDRIQVEKGSVSTAYEPYSKRQVVGYQHLPKDLQDMAEKYEGADGAGLSTTITVANSDKIGFFSNSFLNGYCMLGKHAINNMSMYSDYIMYNYGHSGEDMLGMLGRINSNEAWLGDVPVRDWGIRYGVIAMQDNDGALYAASSDTYYENAKKLCMAIRSMGGTPILGTEHDWSPYYYNLARLAQEQNLMMMDWGHEADKLNRVFPPFWFNRHPSTRTAWIWSDGMKPYLDTLPRPRRSIKLFRVRPGLTVADLGTLIYDDVYSRAERYEEISCGVSALTEDSEKYFDRLDTGNGVFANYRDEYQKLQAKTAPVAFGTHCLVEVVMPYDAGGVRSAAIKVDATGIQKAYVKKCNSLDNLLPTARYIAFGIESGTIAPGDEFTITGGVFNENIKGKYTVQAVVNGMVVTTTSSDDKTTSGTDTPVSDNSGLTLKGSFDYPSPEYMRRYREPLGQWLEVTLEDGNINLDECLADIVDYDKVSVLFVGNNIAISDISAVVSGTRDKDAARRIRPMLAVKGESMLADNLFGSGSTWTGIEGLSAYTPVKTTVGNEVELLPEGIDTVRVMRSGQTISHLLDTTVSGHAGYGCNRIQIRIVARYFPEYVNNDTVWANSGIKRGSYDCAGLEVKFGNTNAATVASLHVGLSWYEHIIETADYGYDRIILKALDDNIQIARCEVVSVSALSN